jgi:hypothetical protein
MPQETADDGDLAEHFRPVQGRLAGLGRAGAAIIVLMVCMVIMGISIAIDCLDLLHLHEMIAFGPWGADDQQLETRRNLYKLFLWLQFAIGIATAVVFLMWLYRAYANIVSFGVKDLENSPGWAVGSFFVPVFNLGGPLVIVQELWRASDPRARDSWKEGSASVLAGFWWACFLSGIILGLIGDVIATRAVNFAAKGGPNPVLDISFGTTLSVVARLLTISAGILVIFLIKAIMRRQTEKLDRLFSQTDLQ